MSFQKGMGMIEIIISILVLAIAILGFMALQYRSVELAAEAMQRVEAVNLARNLSERIYVNRIVYSDDSGLLDKGDVSDCLSKDNAIVECDPVAFMAKDIADVKSIAESKAMDINLLTCPDTANNRACIYVAWDETKAEQGDEDDNACTSSDNFAYYPESKCIVIEAF